jgi:uracil-DNA glycosylase
MVLLASSGRVYMVVGFSPRNKRWLHMVLHRGENPYFDPTGSKQFIPRIIVALGATAVLALAGRVLPIARCRGPADFDGQAGYITVHPSSLRRLQGDDVRSASLPSWQT